MTTRVGAYELIKPIGAGGMGEVWLAQHVMLGRRAAIKLLHPSVSSRADIVTRFFNEARAATAIADPGIVQIYDFGHDAGGAAYIVMELLDGETLDARCRRGTMALPDALRVLRQVASSLGAAHVRGIVHRDLKPENIFLVRDPEVPGGERAKVLDFGIAKLAGDPGVKTQTTAVMGTPTFMSPEQCRGAGLVDQRTDVYSLGCVLFTVITGRPPFVAEGIGDLIAMHLREPPPRASAFVPGLAPAVDDLIARCLDKDPARRYASGAELAAALDAVRVSTIPPPPPSSHGFAAAMPTTLSGAAGALAAPPARSPRRGLAIAAWLALGGCAIAGVVLATRSPGAQVIAASPSPPPSDGARAEATVDAATIAATVDAPVDATIDAPIDAPVAVPVEDHTPRAREQILATVIALAAWAREHRGCPAASDLRAEADPWGTALAITCSAQPPDLLGGVTSAGPDRAFGTGDDLVSWRLGTAYTSLLARPRAAVKSAPPRSSPPVVPTPTVPPPVTPPPPPPPAPPAPSTTGIPDKR